MSWDVLIIFLMVFLLFIIVVIITDKMDEKADKRRSHEIEVRLRSQLYLRPNWLTPEEMNDLSKEKKLTREQRKLLNEHGITDTSKWVYTGTVVNDHRDSKSLARNQPKEVVMSFRNVSTDEHMEIIM